ncbi:hypothetical protein SVA_1218 [Sulfurifustis variabilis]|uniref:Uncharacterized protein n=1 Tax=Sulfurifustis variabilis TaxID=1675686 RepID=A0A1B4V2N2_9GAMM|nr:hypothetical protein SVA_1218 [Sulfurifustis variabilis]
MASRVTVTRWLFMVGFVLSFALALVVHGAGGPWYGLAVLGLMALGAAYLAMFASDELLLRVDGWIAALLRWSP